MATIGAFSVNWPYISFSGFSNYIFIINAFNPNIIYRSEIANPDTHALVCDTFIADSNDLFVVIYIKKKYRVYRIDLDYANISEIGEEDTNADINKRVNE